MKRRVAMLLVLAGIALYAQASKKVTAAQFEEAVAGFHSKPDAEVAFLLGDMQLTERLSGTRIDRIQALLAGEKSRQALVAVADTSEFEPPPADEIPSAPPPPMSEQRRILGLVVTYVTKAIPQLPNFMATRTTDRFEDTPLSNRAHLAAIPYQPLHFVARANAIVTYRENREVYEPISSDKTLSRATDKGLSSRGEFGSILSTVLLDAAQNKLEWLRWEGTEPGEMAVFAYSVPREKSHYAVDFCCVMDSEGRSHPFHQVAGYKGQLRVDPTTGTIVHLDVTAELKPTDPIHSAKMAVDYGPVEIGGRTYFCPLHSVAFTRAQGIAGVVQEMAPAAASGQGGMGLAPVAVGTAPTRAEQTMLNDVTFSQYHVFRAESRIVSANQRDGSSGPPEAAVPNFDSSAAAATDTASSVSVNADAPPAPAGESAPPAPGTTSAAPPLARSEAVAPEITIADTADVPNAPTQMQPAGVPSGFRIRTTTRLVDVGLVAFDKKGRPVTDLKQTDFEIYDNGRKQEIKYFGQARQAPPGAVPSPALEHSDGEAAEAVFSNVQATPASQQQTPAPHTTIFLIDSGHVVFTDLAYARSEMLRFLKTVPPDEPVGLYVLRKFGFEILREPTTDHSELAAALSKWMPSAQDLLQSQQEEMRNRQQMEYVRSSKDLLAMNGNIPTGAGDIDSAPDIQRRSLGDRPEQDALGFLVPVARHVAAFKGHKSLIWVASDNVLADFSEKAPQEEKGDKHLQPPALRAREALNEAQVSIYPLDCSQLESNVVGADLQHANVQVKPTSTDFDIPTMGPDPAKDEAKQELEKSKRDINPGRIKAQMQQDAHPIQGTFRELATATGGRALRRASDIAAELTSIVNDGRAAYLLSFTPDSPADDKYHLITLKLTGRRDLKLRYRTGYLYEKEPATLKERFRQAVWQPRDVTDIAVTATRDAAANPAGLKLNIAATDLEMAQAGDRWTNKLDIFLIERDDAESHAKLSARSLAMNLMPATYQNVLHYGIDVDQPLPAKSGAGSFRIVVVDENSGRMGSVTVPAGVR